MSPARRPIATGYALALLLVAGQHLSKDPKESLGMLMAMPAMHLPWAAGFFRGLLPQHPST